MGRTSVLIITSSALLGVGAYLASVWVGSPRDASVALAAACLAGVGARLAPAWTGRILIFLAFVAPAALGLAFGQHLTQFRTMWLVPFTAWVALARSDLRWSVPDPFRPIVICWALTVAIVWPLIFLRELDFTPSLLAAMTSNGLAGQPIWHWTHGVASAALALLAGILWFDLLAARHLGAPAQAVAQDVLFPAAAGASCMAAVALYQSWADPTWLSTRIWINANRATGTLFDANAVGILAATWGVLLAGVLWGKGRRAGPWPSLAALWIGWLAVVASGSRTALAAALVGTALLVPTVVRGRRVAFWKLAVAAGLVALSLVVLVALGGPRTITPLQRIAYTLPRADLHGAAEFGRSLWERNGWGPAAVMAIAEHPVTGLGIGTFNPQSVDYIFRLLHTRITPDNAQNWWRHQAAEWGAVGIAIVLAWTLVVGILLFRGRTVPEDRVAAAGVRGALFGLAFASLLGVPSQVPAVSLSFWTFLFLGLRVLAFPWKPRDWRRAAWAVWGIALLAFTTQAWAATHDLRPPARAQRVGKEYGHGFRRGGSENGEPFWVTGRRAVFVFPLEPGTFEFRATPVHPDIGQRPVRVEVWAQGRRVVDAVARDRAPIEVRIPVQEAGQAVFIETRVDRTFRDGNMATGLRIQKSLTPPAGR